MNPPKWAQGLTLNAILYLQSTRYVGLELPRLTWRHAHNRSCSSGISWHDRSKGINVNAGTDRTDAKLVLLHELAHWARPLGESHSDAFWDLAWELYRWAKLPMRYCKWREAEYRKGSIAAYHRSVKQSR